LVQVMVLLTELPGAAVAGALTLAVTLAGATGAVRVAVSHGPGGVPGAQI
jgi:hypothetical protein